MSNGTPERFKEGVLFSTETEAEACFKKYRSQDPLPNIAPSLLNSADIHDYVAQTGMLAPFYPWAIKSASYEASLLGPLIWWNEKNEPQYKELREGEVFILKANSVAFVSVEPTLKIPDYIALRFNLHITHVHRGLLLGTGPLVDPGFVGKLVIPLHNLTDRDWPINGGEGLIWIEFTKLSRNARWDSSASSEDRIGKYKEFPERKKHKEFFWYLEKAQNARPVRSIRASVGNFEAELKSARQKAERTERVVRRIEVVGLLAILVAAVLGLPPILSLIQESNAYLIGARADLQTVDKTLDALKRETVDTQRKAETTTQQLESTRKELDDVRRRLERLEHSSDHSPKTSGK